MIALRAAIENDFGPWSTMRAALWPSATAEEHLEEIQEFFGKDEFHAWVALNDGQCIGFAEASVRPYANGCDGRPVVFFEGVWVAEQFRKNGIGRKFVEAVEAWARSKGIRELGSDAEMSNSVSHTCHENWGFEETERVIYYRKKL